jgi:hypothetical protein
MATWTATLKCGYCGREGPHDLDYAGRLLASTHCRACGYTVRHMGEDLRKAYFRDFEQRVASKPSRMFRRLRRHPVKFVLSLPLKAASKPKKLLEEVRPLISDHG